MCGITGYVRSDGAPIDRELLARMNEAIHHRGPDEDGFYVSDGVGLAMRRLAIIDLKSGQQPIHNADRTAWIVYNGEIYNYRELRKDLEECGHRFYTDSDTEAIVHYLSFICVPAPLTAYQSIRKLEPGHWLLWRDGEIKTERYWQLDFSNKIDISEQEAGQRVVELLREAVRVRLMSEVPLGAFLSGGIDSSAIVALMAQESSEPVKTFSIGFEEQDFSELHHARRVAEHVGADHHEFIVRPDALEVLPILVEHYGEPYADSSAIPTYYVAREPRKHVTVALNGDGGDASVAGYERYAAMRLAEKYHKLPAMLRWAVIDSAVHLL